MSKFLGGIDGDNPRPTDFGLLGWSVDPANVGASTIITAGRATVAYVPVHGSGTVSKIWVSISTGGASLTVSGLALFDAAGNLLSNAPLAGTAMQSTGRLSATLTTPQTYTPATKGFYVAMWAVGTTMPTPARSGNTFPAVNMKGSGSSLVRFAQTPASSFTTSTPPSTLSTLTENFALLAALE